MRPGELIDAEGRTRLEAVITELEHHTEGEVVLVVVHACDEYGSVGWRVGVTFAAIAYLAAELFVAPLPHWAYLGIQALALLLGHGVARIEAVRRVLLPRALVEQRLAERARRAFAEQGLERTRGRTGVLLLVSTLERRVVVLGDSGIDAVLDPDESWQQVIDLAVAGLREGRAVEGLETALRRCGEMLAHHVPPRTPRADQLPNAVVIEE